MELGLREIVFQLAIIQDITPKLSDLIQQGFIISHDSVSWHPMISPGVTCVTYFSCQVGWGWNVPDGLAHMTRALVCLHEAALCTVSHRA